MNWEKRLIKASLMVGISEVTIGIIMAVTGLHNWYFERFHFFGVLGIGMLLYGGWHSYFLKKETGKKLWKKKQKAKYY